MTPSARIAAVIELFAQWQQSVAGGARMPADALSARYFKQRRYIGSKDRTWIATLYYGMLRHMRALEWLAVQAGLTAPSPRHLCLIALRTLEAMEPQAIVALCDGSRHAPAALDASERKALSTVQPEHLGTHPQMPPDVRVGIPEWLHTRISAQYGAEEAQALLASLMEEAPVDVRANTLKTSRESLRDALRTEGIEAQPTAYTPHGLRLTRRAALTSTQVFRDGWCEVQDEGSQLVAALVEAQPSQRVIDFCAGAGGKTLAIAAQMQGKGGILAWDVQERRLADLPKRLKRAGAHNVRWQVITSESDQQIKRHKASADWVLVDAPCSGSGTWRRNPDLKWRTTPQDIEELVALQRRILDSAARLVKPGGHLVYATCSILEAENQSQAAAFLARHADWSATPFTLAGCDWPEGMMALLPHQHGTDGFFAARWQRVASE